MAAMPSFELLTLDLHAPLPYEGLENPPLSGAPFQGTVLMPSSGGAALEAQIGLGLAEGEEEILLFEEAALIDFDPDQGPRIESALPAPGFYGRAPAAARPADGRAPGPSATRRELPRGRYAFMQWRPSDEGELAEGLEWFARELWWERTQAEGPYIVRRLREDSELATQALRRIKL
jgi:hypothetical protein